MALQRYTDVSVYVNGRLLIESTSISVNRKSGSQPVNTQAKGFAGMSPGSPMMEITIENAVPSADFELDAGSFIRNMDVNEFMFFAAGKSLTTNGFFTDDSFSGAVDTASKLSQNIMAEFAEWQ